MADILEFEQASGWAKIKFFWQHSLALLTMTATSEETGYSKENVWDTRGIVFWKATSTADQYLTWDAGVGLTYTADYFILGLHNLYSAGATVVLQSAGEDGIFSDVFTAFAPTHNGHFLREFEQLSRRQWRIKITGCATIPFATASFFGLKTELGYAAASYDPNARNDKANVVTSDTGYLLGVYSRYIERSMEVQFRYVDEALWAKLDAWWTGTALGNFFVAWETTEHPDDLYLMRSEAKWQNPIQKMAGTIRQVSVRLTGRKF